ncbi:piggyBac transposable element-derived protein 4-like [Schistocerca nitens]|uniref:piggyBac transposable element-derived protein 4-like n=1 Tax=Schistocerca nitens TaxID=7011 RepID=UPI0021172C85|nr:piggyBac transposable element-derived protein 4-like [Schistocerca nitens]
MFRRGLSDAEIADLINHSDTLDNVESDSDDSECNGVFEEDEIDDSLSSDEDENDVEGVASNPAAVPYPKDSEWTAVDTYRPLPVNTTPRQILVDIDESSSVLDCSKVFLTDSDVNELKRQTNLYASQTIQKKRRGNNLKPHSVLSSWKPVTISEMRRFLGIIFHMCVSKKPKIADHWSTNPVLSCNFCPHVMSRLRFTQILSCLHLVDNSNQKKPGEDGFHPLYKVLPYYNNLKERCIQAYRPSEKTCKKTAFGGKDQPGLKKASLHSLYYMPPTVMHLRRCQKKGLKSSVTSSAGKEFDTTKYSQIDITYQSDEDDETNVGHNLNTSLTSVGISPLKFQRIGARDTKGYATCKIHQVEGAIIKKIAEVGGLDPSELEQPSTKKRFEDGCTVSGTRDHHHFVPIDEKQLKIHRVSSDTSSFKANVNQHAKVDTEHVAINELQPGQYVACVYDGKW